MAKAKAQATPPQDDAAAGEAKPRREKRGYRMTQVKKALRRLGPDAKPLQIQEYLLKRGLEMDASVISNYKGILLKRQAETAGEEGPAAAARPSAAPRSAARSTAGSGSISVDDLRAVKELADRMGADNLRQIIDLVVK